MSEKMKTGSYIEAVGRRKTSIARVRLSEGARTDVSVNGATIEKYFKTEALRMTALEPLLKVSLKKPFSVSVRVSGGGVSSQAGAIRHGISRALTASDQGLRGDLKKLGFLRRDPRAKERRKFGFKKARKRKQWSKR
ncbi:MAG TPA: 30S ribosomal protein S9 [Candidatus Paceibacterota bacterium]